LRLNNENEETIIELFFLYISFVKQLIKKKRRRRKRKRKFSSLKRKKYYLCVYVDLFSVEWRKRRGKKFSFIVHKVNRYIFFYLVNLKLKKEENP